MKMCHPAELVSYSIIFTYFSFTYSTDTADFNTTIFEVTFPGDTNLQFLTNVSASIHVKDDTKDEAFYQFFIAYLEIVHAINPDTIVIGREWATIIIVDNDSK